VDEALIISSQNKLVMRDAIAQKHSGEMKEGKKAQPFILGGKRKKKPRMKENMAGLEVKNPTNGGGKQEKFGERTNSAVQKKKEKQPRNVLLSRD